jgi:hypothetical protein
VSCGLIVLSRPEQQKNKQAQRKSSSPRRWSYRRSSTRLDHQARVHGRILVTKADRRETHASLVLLGPTRWALLPRRVNGLLAFIAESELGEAFARVVSSGIERLPRPASVAFASGLSASRTQRGTCAARGQLRRRFAEANRCKTVACLVLRRPARWALLTRRVHWRFSLFAEAQFRKTFACVVACGFEAFSGPATFITLAGWRAAMGANAGTLTRLRKLLWWLAEADCCKTIAGLVFRWPTRWALLARGVHWLFSVFAEAKLREARARLVRCVIKAGPWPASIITFACRRCAIWAQVLASAVCRQRGRRKPKAACKDQNAHCWTGSGE